MCSARKPVSEDQLSKVLQKSRDARGTGLGKESEYVVKTASWQRDFNIHSFTKSM